MGFAFDPTDEPPREMDPKDILNMEWGAQVKTFMRSAIALRNTTETLSAYRLLAGRGLSTLLFFPESSELRTRMENFAIHSCEVFRPMMHDGAFQSFGFYLPLLSSENLAKTHVEQLAVWLGDTVIYLREAFEAHEVLLLARCQLEPAFEKLQMIKQPAGASQAGWTYKDFE